MLDASFCHCLIEMFLNSTISTARNGCQLIWKFHNDLYMYILSSFLLNVLISTEPFIQFRTVHKILVQNLIIKKERQKNGQTTYHWWKLQNVIQLSIDTLLYILYLHSPSRLLLLYSNSLILCLAVFPFFLDSELNRITSLR